MPKTKTATIKAEAKRIASEDEPLSLSLTDNLEESNFEYLQKLNYEDLCLCFEYMYLLREVHGIGGFLRSIKTFKDNLPSAWKEIRRSGLSSILKGREEGFIQVWMTKRIYDRIKTFSKEQMAAWLTYVDRSATYRLDILKGEKHQLLGSERASVIEEWLDEV